MRILPDPMSNYANSAARHPSWLVSLCLMWWQRIFWSKFSCTILPFNHTHQFQSQLDLAVPISSASSLCQMREGLLGTFQKSSRVRRGYELFSWVSLGLLPWPSGAAKNEEEVAQDCVREQKSVLFLAKNSPAVSLSLPWPNCTMFSQMTFETYISPFFTCTGTVRHGSYFTVNLNRCSWIQNTIFWAFRECWLTDF